ncbi:MAG: class D sortase [Lachnospiraceae bacterium]|nr:class D sortase [Lachnospiraceae bacterium]
MKNKKKIIVTIAGIILILGGIVIFCIPIFFQTKNSIANDEKLDYINELIEKNQKALAENKSAEKKKNEADINSVSTDESETKVEVGTVTAIDDETAAAQNAFVIDAPIFDEFPIGGFESIGDEGGSIMLGEGEAPVEELDPAEIASRLEGQNCVGVITCDKIDLCYAIVEGVEYANIGVSIGHFEESAGIGQEGNCALAGHNGGFYGRYFGDIKDLRKGDEIKLTDLLGQEFTYNVTTSFKCEPTDIEVVGELEEKGKYLTLVTCCENGARRYIVRAKCTKPPVLIKQVK